MPTGLSFLPSTMATGDRAQANALTPGQSAVDVISLNLPRILGVKPLASANLLGGGETGATRSVDPQQIVWQALMQSSMSTPQTGAPSSGRPSQASALEPSPAGMSGPLDDELRKRLQAMFGSSSAPTPQAPIFTPGDGGAPALPSPPVSPAPQTPIFTPGDYAHPTNSPMNLRPITETFSQPGMLRK